MVLSDEEVRQVADLIADREAKRNKTKPFSNIPMRTRLIIAGVFILVALYAYNKHWTFTKTMVYLVIIAAVVWLLFMQDAGLPVELTEWQCHVSLNAMIKRYRQVRFGGQYAVPRDADYVVGMVGKRVVRDGKPLWREFLVTFSYPDGREDEYTAKVDVFTGDLVGFAVRPFGYQGSETPDIKTIPSAQLKIQRSQKAYLDGDQQL